MSRIVLRTLLSIVLAVSVGTALAAPVQQIDNQSNLHRIEAVHVGKPSVSVLRHTVVPNDGVPVVSVVPGTLDVAIDRDPALAIDPVRGIPVLAWSRDSGNGFDIFVSRYDENAWTPPVSVLHSAGDEVRPQIQVSSTLVQVVAHQGADYVWVSLNRSSLEPAFGPETLPTNVTPITPGVDEDIPAPPSENLYFASDVVRLSSTDPGHVVIWGVRDEPVPIDYVQALLLPVTFEEAGSTLAAPIEGSLTVTVASDSLACYTLFRQATWAQFSAVTLDETTTLSDVREMLGDLIRREP